MQDAVEYTRQQGNIVPPARARVALKRATACTAKRAEPSGRTVSKVCHVCPAVAPTPPGVFHAPRVKAENCSTPWRLQAPVTGSISEKLPDRLTQALVSSFPYAHSCTSPAYSLRFFVCCADFSLHRSCPSEWEWVVHIRRMSDLKPMVDSSFVTLAFGPRSASMCWHAAWIFYSLKCDCICRIHQISRVPLSCCQSL